MIWIIKYIGDIYGNKGESLCIKVWIVLRCCSVEKCIYRVMMILESLFLDFVVKFVESFEKRIFFFLVMIEILLYMRRGFLSFIIFFLGGIFFI